MTIVENKKVDYTSDNLPYSEANVQFTFTAYLHIPLDKIL